MSNNTKLYGLEHEPDTIIRGRNYVSEILDSSSYERVRSKRGHFDAHEIGDISEEVDILKLFGLSKEHDDAYVDDGKFYINTKLYGQILPKGFLQIIFLNKAFFSSLLFIVLAFVLFFMLEPEEKIENF
jgi:hypothetical protein